MAELDGKRLRDLIDERGLNQSALAEMVGLTQPSIGRLIAGETRSTAKLIELAVALQTTPEYLTGQSDEREAGGAMKADRRPYRPPPKRAPDDIVQIPQVDFAFGLGATYLDGPAQPDLMSFSRAWVAHFTRASPDQLFWAKCDGDSMEPTIRSSEVVLIDRGQNSLRTRDNIWAIAMGDTVMIKRLRPHSDGSVEILSDNPAVPPYRAVDGEMHLIGRVVAVVRRL